MRRIERSTAFKRDYRRAKAISGYRDLDEQLGDVIELLVNDHPLPPRSRDHTLSGNWSGYRDCRLWPDLLLIYAKPAPDVLRFVRLVSAAIYFEMNLHQVPETMTLHRALWAGRIMSAFVVIALVADGTIQLFAPAQIASMLQETGFAMDLTRVVGPIISPAPSFTPSRPPPSSARS